MPLHCAAVGCPNKRKTPGKQLFTSVISVKASCFIIMAEKYANRKFLSQRR